MEYIQSMKTITFLLLTLLMISLQGFASSGKVKLPQQGALFGAYVEAGALSDHPTSKAITNLQNQVGHKLSWVYFSNNWLNKKIRFPSESVQTCISNETIPYIRLMPWSVIKSGPAPDPIFTMDAFLNGDFDQEVKQWALEAKDVKTQLILEFGPEVNGNWFPWNGQWNGAGETTKYGDPILPDGPEKFRDVYRRIIDIFRKNKVKNVTWVFHVDTARMPHRWWNRAEYYYPGDDYIDWIGLSVFGAQLPTHKWVHFMDKMHDFWPELRSLVKNKPLIISEFAVIEDKSRPLRKAQWLEETFEIIENEAYPIKAVAYWNSYGWLADGSANFRLDSSKESIETIKSILSRDFWKSNSSNPDRANRETWPRP